jgi:flavin-dependent dehydrogenase
VKASRVDVVIVGGGPAGLATALFLVDAAPERAGRVVVLEKERYPRDKICAGAIGGRAERLLASIGVRVDVPSAPVHGMSLRVPGASVVRRREGIGRVVRRVEFDAALAGEARRRGITIVDGARVTGVEVGARGALVRASHGDVEAQAIVGADGVGSVVRRAMGLPTGRLTAQVVEVDTPAAAGDPPRDVLHFDLSDLSHPGYAWDFPTIVGGEPLVCRGVYQIRVGRGPFPDVRALLDARLRAQGLEPAGFRVKRFAERGFELHRAYAAPRVLLVGEAAGVDPVTGEGIAQAISYGRVAGRYLAEQLARGDTSFAGFRARLAASSLGVDLLLRRLALPLTYHPVPRAFVRSWLAASEPFLDLALAAFGGEPLARRDALGAGASLFAHAARWARGDVA